MNSVRGFFGIGIDDMPAIRLRGLIGRCMVKMIRVEWIVIERVRWVHLTHGVFCYGITRKEKEESFPSRPRDWRDA